MLAITDTAAEAIRTLTTDAELPDGGGLRISPPDPEQGLELSLAGQPNTDDVVLAGDGVSVFLEPVVAPRVENNAAVACVRAALDAGITTFDTADAYANGAAETVLGEALKGERRASLEILTKVYWPTGPKGPNDSGLSRKHIMESIDASLTRLQTDYVDLYQAHRFDVETPLEETMQAFADVVRAGKALYIGVSEWTAEQLRAGQALATELGFRLISNQPQYSMLWRVIEGEVVPASEELGISQIVWSPIGQGVLTGKYKPGSPPPPGSRATDESGSYFIE